MDAPNLNHLWANLLVEELIRNGVRNFVIAPGSRSTPLATAAFRNTKAATITHFDERGAAFFALGSGRMGKPAAVICTSGSAVANCLPAVAEASHSALPLVILSADRPPELQGCAANQTMDQAHLFGSFVRANIEIPCPEPCIAPETLLTRLDAALERGLLMDPGPIHINCAFREPLAPVQVLDAFSPAYSAQLKRWEHDGHPFTRWETPKRALSGQTLEAIAGCLSASRRGLVLVGRLNSAEEQSAVLALAVQLGWPVFADITAGGLGSDRAANVIHHHDLLLRSEKFRAFLAPDTVLHLGDVFVSKQIQDFLRQLDATYIQISSREQHRDPLHRVTQRYVADLVSFCQDIRPGFAIQAPNACLEACLELDALVEKGLCELAANDAQFTEITVARLVDAFLSHDRALFVGNSMPVRDVDMFAFAKASAVIHANRGVSGIDGLIATAAGMQHASGHGVIALIGDMAALHDLNSLALIAAVPPPFVLIIINNHGGGIFSFLPIAQYPDILEPCFTHSHGWYFESAARMFNLEYQCADTAERFRGALQRAQMTGTSSIIEVVVDRKKNVDAHADWFRNISQRVDGYFGRS